VEGRRTKRPYRLARGEEEEGSCRNLVRREASG
jgi:hypothetical protein